MTKTALLVEDNDLNHLLFQEVLTHLGFKVVSDRTGRTSKALCQADGRPGSASRASGKTQDKIPDLAVVDLALPDISGLEVIRSLRAAPRTRDMPIIAVSAFARTQDGLAALNAGADLFFCKPVDVSRLCAALDKLTDELQVGAA
ncbi:MAG: response regulator [Pseudomonadota bacterium]